MVNFQNPSILNMLLKSGAELDVWVRVLLLRNWNGKGSLKYDQDKISHRQSTNHTYFEKIITTKEVQIKMLIEKE